MKRFKLIMTDFYFLFKKTKKNKKDLTSHESQLKYFEDDRDHFRSELNKYKRFSQEYVSILIIVNFNTKLINHFLLTFIKIKNLIKIIDEFII